MDRFTWGVVGGVVVLSLLAVFSVLFVRQNQAPPDISTPEGVVAAYVGHIQNKRADEAWKLLAPEAVAGMNRGSPGSPMTQDQFRQQVDSGRYGPRDRRIRIVAGRISGDTAQVDLEIAFGTRDFPPFGGGFTRDLAMSLKRSDSSWLITSTPTPGELA